jgi:ATP-dependent Lon protease
MATAITSALCKIPVHHDVAMTGEITLRGRVLPIGGLKEKTMAAYRAGIKKVIIPMDNVSDLAEIDSVVKDSLQFLPVDKVEDALKAALLYMPQTQMENKDAETVPETCGHTIAVPHIPQ